MITDTLIFFFYEVKNPWDENNMISHGIRAVGSVKSQRYERYFLSFWFEIPELADTQTLLDKLDYLERGDILTFNLSGNEWDISGDTENVTFYSFQFDEWNNGVDNVFKYADFKTLLLAWHKFLRISMDSAGVKYTFKVSKYSSKFIHEDNISLIKLNN